MMAAPCFALLLCVALGTTRAASQPDCADEATQKWLAHSLYVDLEAGYRYYVCGEEPCTEEAFRLQLRVRQERLGDAPPSLGCFVEPASPATNSLTALFLFEGSKPKLELVFSGTYLSPEPRSSGSGPRALIGTHREGDQALERYVWNGRHYRLTSKRPVAPEPAEGVTECNEPHTRQRMAQRLYKDWAFRSYTCDDPSCSEKDFSRGLSYEQKILRDNPLVVGCFASPTERDADSLTAVFAIVQRVPILQFVHRGLRVELEPAARDQGYVRLIGSRRDGETTRVLQHYRWKGKSYARATTTTETVNARRQ